MEIKEGMKLNSEVILIDDITYGTEPKYYGDSGIRHIYKFLDHEDNIFTWFTSKVIGIDFIDDKGNEGWKFINEGDIISISAVIKEIGTYKGEDQVILTRCKILAIVKEAMFTEEKITLLKRTIQLAKYDKNSIYYEIKTVPYKEYKNNYSNCETVIDSFVRTDHGCFIDIIVQ